MSRVHPGSSHILARCRLAVFALLAAFALCAGWPVAARGDEDADFRRHYERALKLYDSGKYQESAKEFQAAYAIKQLPKLLLNLGQVHRRLGHAKEALAYYEFYLRVEPNPEPKLKVELDRYIAQTKAMLEAAQRAKQEAGARAEREDAPPPELAIAPKPAPEPVTPPKSAPEPAVTAPKPAPEPAAETPKPAAAPVPWPETPAPKPVASLPPQATEPDVPPPRPVYKKPWFWGVMSVVGVVVIGGAVTGIVLGTRQPEPPPGIEIHDWSLRVRP